VSSPPLALVTGIAGQDGTLIAAELVRRGRRIVGIARPGAAARLAGDARRRALLAGVEVVELNLQDGAALRECVAQAAPAEIFHLAAEHHSAEEPPERAQQRHAAMRAVNFGAAEIMIEAARALPRPPAIVLASSSQIWTPTRPAQAVSETEPPAPATYYGLTKLWAMECAAYFRRRDGLRASSAILFNHESPLRGEAFVTQKICRHAARIARGDRARLSLRNIGAGADWSAAQDIVRGVVAIAESAQPGEYLLASGTGRTVRDLLDAAFMAAGRDWRETVDAEKDEPAPYLIGTTTRARDMLGWDAQIGFGSMVNAMFADAR
jgi:GDPmannose 4,6-dehydratase